jgi:3-hydroxyisobutyrate dehydrogenase
VASSSHQVRIGFVGLGAMGAPMSGRLVDAGFDVVGFDVSEDARDRARARGVRVVDRVGQVADQVDVLILMLPNSNVVETVVHDEQLVANLMGGIVLIDMSSSEPARTRDISQELDGRGIRMIDAPVSGGVAGAVKGTLTVMVGGSPTVLDDVRSVLDVLGRVVYAGPIGSGHAVKALNNLLSATHLLAASEVMLAGQQFGLDPEVMLAVFNSSSGRSGSTENKWPNFILPETFDSGFGLRMMLKDMVIAVQLAAQGGVPCELGDEAVALWSEAADGLPATADHTEIVRWLRQRMGAREV